MPWEYIDKGMPARLIHPHVQQILVRGNAHGFGKRSDKMFRCTAEMGTDRIDIQIMIPVMLPDILHGFRHGKKLLGQIFLLQILGKSRSNTLAVFRIQTAAVIQLLKKTANQQKRFVLRQRQLYKGGESHREKINMEP